MKANENKRTSIWLRILLWINLLNSFILIGAYIGTHISPNGVYYFAFLGLSYPVWISVAAGFLVFWFFFKPKWMLVSVITIAIGFNHFRHFIAITLVQPKVEDAIKIMSFNVKIFNLYDLENRETKRNGIFSFLKAEDPGIICFQEFYHQEEGKSFVTKDSMVKLLNTNYYHERYTHDMADKKYFGVATFSKYPIVNKGEIPFENDANNFCIYSDIVVDSDTFRVFNAHIGSIRFQQDDYAVFDENTAKENYVDLQAEEQIIVRLKSAFEKRAVQAETIAKEIEVSPYPVILCGDLNDTPVSYCYRQFSRLLNDAFVESGNGIGATYIGEMPSNRIDYIFHSTSLLSARFTTHDVEFSDHRPISCLIDLKK